MTWRRCRAGWAEPLPLLPPLSVPRGFLKAKGNRLSRACGILVPGERGKNPFPAPCHIPALPASGARFAQPHAGASQSCPRPQAGKSHPPAQVLQHPQRPAARLSHHFPSRGWRLFPSALLPTDPTSRTPQHQLFPPCQLPKSNQTCPRQSKPHQPLQGLFAPGFDVSLLK